MLAYITYMDPVGIAMANETFINELVTQVTHHKIVILHVVGSLSSSLMTMVLEPSQKNCRPATARDTHTQHVSHDNELLEFLPIVCFNIIYMYIHVEVSLNSGSPCIFYSKPSILGYPHFRKPQRVVMILSCPAWLTSMSQGGSPNRNCLCAYEPPVTIRSYIYYNIPWLVELSSST